jgi:hypothetical protein
MPRQGFSFPVEFGSVCRTLPVKLGTGLSETVRKMRRLQKAAKNTKIPLDKVSVKPGRGRTAQMPAPEVLGRADNYGEILAGLWDVLWPLLQKAQTDQDVIDAFEKNATLDTREFVPNLASLIFRVLRERKFPKRRREAQIKFLADSIAGLGYLAPRSSRDICEKERAREKRAHHIIRYEVYVECSCGFAGRSRDHACQKCGAAVNFGFTPLF